MKYVFFGTPEFSAIILEKLVNAGLPPLGVVCNPDRPTGRKKIITPPAIKARIMNYELGIRNKIQILQPEILDNSLVNQLLNYKPAFAVVASYSKIIPKNILDVFPLGAIGVHPSLLPKYRGPTPIQSAILNGEKETGVSLYSMDEKMDNGPVLASSKLQIPNYKKYTELHDELANLSADLLIKTLPKFINGELKPQEQDHAKATFTKKFFSQDGFISAEELEKAKSEGGQVALEIDRKVRALNPEPGTWTTINDPAISVMLNSFQHLKPNARIKILKTSLNEKGLLLLKKIQLEGKKPQTIG